MLGFFFPLLDVVLFLFLSFFLSFFVKVVYIYIYFFDIEAGVRGRGG